MYTIYLVLSLTYIKWIPVKIYQGVFDIASTSFSIVSLHIYDSERKDKLT